MTQDGRLTPADGGLEVARRTDVLVAVFVITPAVSNLGSLALDGAARSQDAFGNVVWTGLGPITTTINGGLLLLALVASARLLSARRKFAAVAAVSKICLGLAGAAFLLALLSLVRKDGADQVQGAVIAGTFLLTLGYRVPAHHLSWKWCGRAAAFVSLLASAYMLLGPASKVNPCRVDKCSIAGELWKAFYSNENTFALYTCLTIPLLAFLGRAAYRWAAVANAVILALGAGSRTGLIILGAGLIGFALIRSQQHRESGEDKNTALNVLRWAPILGVIGSALIYFLASPASLTGRGLVYSISRGALETSLAFGPGRGILSNAFIRERTGIYRFAHEHGETAYILNNLGVVGVLAVMVLLARTVQLSQFSLVAVAVALPPSVAFLTEPVWELSYRSPYFWSLILWVIALSVCGAAVEKRFEREPSKPDPVTGPRPTRTFHSDR